MIKTYFPGTVCLSCKTHSMKVDVVDGENWSRIRADAYFVFLFQFCEWIPLVGCLTF